jgi:hypothetical protein
MQQHPLARACTVRLQLVSHDTRHSILRPHLHARPHQRPQQAPDASQHGKEVEHTGPAVHANEGARQQQAHCAAHIQTTPHSSHRTGALGGRNLHNNAPETAAATTPTASVRCQARPRRLRSSAASKSRCARQYQHCQLKRLSLGRHRESGVHLKRLALCCEDKHAGGMCVLRWLTCQASTLVAALGAKPSPRPTCPQCHDSTTQEGSNETG